METQHNSTKSNTHLNALNPDRADSSNLKEIKKIDGTPFNAVYENEQWFGLLGNYRVTDMFQSEEELIRHVNEKPWNLIASLVHIAVLKAEEIKEFNNTIERGGNDKE